MREEEPAGWEKSKDWHLRSEESRLEREVGIGADICRHAICRNVREKGYTYCRVDGPNIMDKGTCEEASFGTGERICRVGTET